MILIVAVILLLTVEEHFVESICTSSISPSSTSIADFLYYNCSVLETILIPTSVRLIGDGAFQYCSSLTAALIPTSVTYLGIGAFAYCSSIQTVSIPSSLPFISHYTFNGCSSLISVVIPTSVTAIGALVFYGCGAMLSVTIPTTVIFIDNGAFQYCKSLTSVVLPTSLSSFGAGTFAYGSGISSVTIPTTVFVIGNYSFYGCKSLTGVIIPTSVSVLGVGAFQGCTSLATVKLPNITSMQWNAFGQDQSLNCVLAPSPAIAALVQSTCTSPPCPPLGGCSKVSLTAAPTFTWSPSMVPTARPTSFNSTIAVSTSGDSNVTISLYALVGIIIGSAVFLAILVVLVYHLIVRKRSSKVEDGSSSFKNEIIGYLGEINAGSYSSADDVAAKFNCPTEFFVFGGDAEYRDGLTKKINDYFSRSIEEECMNNEDGKWAEHYKYVVEQPAVETVLDPNNPIRVRDDGHGGMKLQDFVNSPIAIGSELTQAEVAVLRMYTGPFYQPWNYALRAYNSHPNLLRCWETCIATLYSAVYKLSFQNNQRLKVFRGVNESKMQIPQDFFSSGLQNSSIKTLSGGVELAFMSTSTDIKVAVEFAMKGTQKVGTVFEIPFNMASRGASVQWVSQYPYENELLYPPCTYLTCEKVHLQGNSVKFIQVGATVCAARPDVSKIRTVHDKSNLTDYLAAAAAQTSSRFSVPVVPVTENTNNNNNNNDKELELAEC